jgi:hypothetical protein
VLAHNLPELLGGGILVLLAVKRMGKIVIKLGIMGHKPNSFVRSIRSDSISGIDRSFVSTEHCGAVSEAR